MNQDPLQLLFSGLEKLGPGDDRDTLYVLDLLPRGTFRTVVDAGCGTGRQTITLAKRLRTLIHGIDLSRPFLDELDHRAREAGVAAFVQTHCMDMAAIPDVFREIDLLWSEGAAYNIGFENALATWAQALAHCGYVVVSELCWLRDDRPAHVVEFFRTAYGSMRTVNENLEIATGAGYQVLATHVLPPAAWTDGYYDALGPRARALLDHPDPAVRELAAETVNEIQIFEGSEDCYGYVFFVLRHGGEPHRSGTEGACAAATAHALPHSNGTIERAEAIHSM